MTKRKTTKRALLLSALSLLVCVSMLVGSTFAWFTDSVTSSGNIIKSGTLDVTMEYFDGTKAVPAADSDAWIDASTGAIFNYSLWEPGFTQVRHIKIANEGTLALQYQISIAANGEVTDLADVIDVYYVDPAVQVAGRGELTAEKKLGTLTQVLAAVDTTASGILEAGENDTITIALKMQETAGNQYQGKKIGADFSVILAATQVDVESDSFGPDYDEGLVPPDADGNILVEENGIQYVYTPEGENVLYLVPEDYAEDTVVIPEGVTTIGNYAFAYNSNVKEVVLPSSVKSLGRGFVSSTVEKVVLNEGLEQIDSRAFRSTPNLKEVVISSSVKTIADNAFQKSGIKEIVIPASVETIGETAFGSSKIETVTIEGNTSVQGFAFRGCPELRTVYLKGDDVTFIPSTLNGRNSMWFCNGESNNPNTSDITFYVKNATVAARVKTAMGAEANNTPVYIEESLFVPVKNLAEFQAALDNAVNNTTITLSADIAGDVTFTQKNDVSLVLDGNGKKMNGSINIIARADIANAATLDIKNFNFETTDATRYFIKSSETNRYPNNLTISNCTFEGTGADSTVVPVNVKSANNLVIKDCKANNVHSLLMNDRGGWNYTIQNCEVTNAGRGLNLNSVQGALVEGVKIQASDEKYGIRIDAEYNNSVTIKDCEISAFCPVVVRKASANYALVFEGENTMTAANTDGIWCAIGTSEYEANGALPTAATGLVTVTLNDTGLNAAGVYGEATN